MMQSPDGHDGHTESQESAGQIPTLQEVLVQTSLTPGRVLDANIHRIQAGSLDAIYLELVRESFSDPEMRECYRAFYVNIDGTFTIEPDLDLPPVWGIRSRVTLEALDVQIIDPTSTDIMRRQNRLVAQVPHPHSRSTLGAPSAKDIFTLLLSPDSYPEAHTSIGVACLDDWHLLFRGPNSPKLTRQEIDERIVYWNNEVERRVKARTPRGMSREDQKAIVDEELRNALEHEICPQYGIRWFRYQYEPHHTQRVFEEVV